MIVNRQKTDQDHENFARTKDTKVSDFVMHE